MKTYEIYNPEYTGQKILRKADGRTYHFGVDGVLYSEGGNPAMQVQIGEDWELLPQLVSWQDAIQAWADNKNVRVECEGDYGRMYKESFGPSNLMCLTKRLIKNGHWYIK